MKEKTKKTFITFFSSLIKNESAIEGAKTAPWWIAIVLFFVGNFIPIIPIMVQASQTYGASFISSNTYGYEQGLATVGLDLQADGYELTVKNNRLIAKKDGEEIKNTWVEEDGIIPDLVPIAHYTAVTENSDGVISERRALNVFYSDRPYSDIFSKKGLITKIEATRYLVGFDIVYNSEEHAGLATHLPSYLVLYKDGIYGRIFKPNTATASSGSYQGCDWKHTADCDLLERITTVENITPNERDIYYVDGIHQKWKAVFNESYLNRKVESFWFQSGLYYGIYLVLGVFMGLMMFLLTRGKYNPNRNLNFWITCKISAWICLSPAVLGMILGFVWSAAAGIGYIVLIGLRTMWLSMRQLNPTAQQR